MPIKFDPFYKEFEPPCILPSGSQPWYVLPLPMLSNISLFKWHFGFWS